MWSWKGGFTSHLRSQAIHSRNWFCGRKISSIFPGYLLLSYQNHTMRWSDCVINLPLPLLVYINQWGSLNGPRSNEENIFFSCGMVIAFLWLYDCPSGPLFMSSSSSSPSPHVIKWMKEQENQSSSNSRLFSHQSFLSSRIFLSTQWEKEWDEDDDEETEKDTKEWSFPFSLSLSIWYKKSDSIQLPVPLPCLGSLLSLSLFLFLVTLEHLYFSHMS